MTTHIFLGSLACLVKPRDVLPFHISEKTHSAKATKLTEYHWYLGCIITQKAGNSSKEILFASIKVIGKSGRKASSAVAVEGHMRQT